MENQNTSSVENAPEQPPMQSVGSRTLLAKIDIAIIHAFESGYIQGHNDTVDGAFNNRTHFVADDRSQEIRRAVRDFLKANVIAQPRRTGEPRKAEKGRS